MQVQFNSKISITFVFDLIETMRILQLTKKFPYPPHDGESLLVSNFNKVLKGKVNSIDLLSFNTIKHYFDIKTLPKDQNHYRNIYDVYLDNRIKWYEALVNLFSKTPYHISRFIVTEFNEKLKNILNNKQYDYILIESLFFTPYIDTIKKYSEAKVIMRAHNVEYEIWERITKNTTFLPKKIYLNYLAKTLKKYELSHINDFDVLITLTERDLKEYKGNGFTDKGFVIPAGIECEKSYNSIINYEDRLKISFLGSLDWAPNIEGINWFINKVWRELLRKDNDIELHIAGRNTPKSIYKLQNNSIKVHGEVPNAKEFLNSYPIMIVPLLSGGGMRLKILEALALGRIIITTSIGLEGIEAKNGKEVLIANTQEEFLEKIIYCKNNQKNLKEISTNAIKLFKTKYNLSNLVDNFLKVIH